MGKTRAAPARCLAIWAALTGIAIVAIWVCWPDVAGLIEGRPLLTFEAWLSAGAAVVGVLCIAWLWLVSTIAVAEAATGRFHPTIAGCPLVLRRLVLASCGVAIVSGAMAPATASVIRIDNDGQSETSARVVQGLPLPERAAITVPPPNGADSRRAPASPGPDRTQDSTGPLHRGQPEVVPDADAEETSDSGQVEAQSPTTASSQSDSGVQPSNSELGADSGDRRARPSWLVVSEGDTLWGLADSLTAAAPAQQRELRVASLTRRLYLTNREVIGDNPDLIKPNQHLQVPTREEQ